MCAGRAQVDTGAALEPNEAAQQQQQAPSAQRAVEETRNILGVPSAQVLERAPRLMDSVRIRVPDSSSAAGGKHRMVDGVVLGSTDGGAQLKVRWCRSITARHVCTLLADPHVSNEAMETARAYMPCGLGLLLLLSKGRVSERLAYGSKRREQRASCHACIVPDGLPVRACVSRAGVDRAGPRAPKPTQRQPDPHSHPCGVCAAAWLQQATPGVYRTGMWEASYGQV